MKEMTRAPSRGPRTNAMKPRNVGRMNRYPAIASRRRPVADRAAASGARERSRHPPTGRRVGSALGDVASTSSCGRGERLGGVPASMTRRRHAGRRVERAEHVGAATGSAYSMAP